MLYIIPSQVKPYLVMKELKPSVKNGERTVRQTKHPYSKKYEAAQKEKFIANLRVQKASGKTINFRCFSEKNDASKRAREMA